MRIIKLSSAWLGPEEEQAVNRVFANQALNMGFETKMFEEELASFFNKKGSFVSCVHSCTAALQLALQCDGIKPGDEVLVPTCTFVATFQAISAVGAKPIPCDIDLDDVFISLCDAKVRLTSKTRAIVPVLFAGCSTKIHKIYQFAEENNLKVVEDAAHSFGDDSIADRLGTVCFSFDAIKNITCSDGGAVLTTDITLNERIKDARLLGVLGDTAARFAGKRSWDFDVVEQGWRLHMNNLCAAIGRAQLAKFPQIRTRRQDIAARYMNAFRDIKCLRMLPINAKTAVPHIFPVIVEDGMRDALKEFLLENGVETGIQYKPNHLLSYFNLGYQLPNAMKVYESILSIPLHPLLSADDVSYIIDSIKKFFK
ncbi:aminotransferase [Alphaproteobacteria bacterium]|nr:aminotransferase [Alphaproteobacteria bacterium]